MADDANKARARARVIALVQSFARNERDYLGEGYSESQARTDFITPLLEALGWDVSNERGLRQSLREVIVEATVEVGEEKLSKKPDYELRLARQRKLFVEAKRPSLSIDRDRASAFQTRRYGYSASLPVSVLTNFYQLAIYDCQPAPNQAEEANVARLALFSYREFEDRFDELWDVFSREAVYSGAFDRRFAVGVTRRGAEQFDDYFLAQVRTWRERLAIDIYANDPIISTENLSYAVQLFLSRIVFLRICEDRDLERYETLRGLARDSTFAALMDLLRAADDFYDSGLFRLLDDDRLGIRISDATLQSIVDELYYPQSPYTFAVVDSAVLGEIYEQFLGETISIETGRVEIVQRPEVVESDGVVPTPGFIVDAIVQRTLGPAIADKGPEELSGFTIADICCGSGSFLLAAYVFLLDHYLTWYLANDPVQQAGRTIYEKGGGEWCLTFEEKRRILEAHVRGVDVDPNAVEVTRFSLLLKLIESESAEGLQNYVRERGSAALPSLDTNIQCGNSLVNHSEGLSALGRWSDALVGKINPFT